ncbi:hypothetical protein AF47_04993 [Klebsiella aerogenes MGH 61]|nr:hypothetical protein AF47_04993 [Klebsiella aerogenes MGH 61]
MMAILMSTGPSMPYTGRWGWSRPEVSPSDAVEAGGNASNGEIYTYCYVSFVLNMYAEFR